MEGSVCGKLVGTCMRHSLFVELIVVFVALCAPRWAGAGEVWSVERGQPAPAAGVLLNDDAAEHVAFALLEMEELRAEVELLTAKLVVSDARAADLLAQVAALEAVVTASAEQVSLLREAAEKDVVLRDRALAAIERQADALERARAAVERAGRRTVWDWVWDVARSLIVVLPFLLAR